MGHDLVCRVFLTDHAAGIDGIKGETCFDKMFGENTTLLPPFLRKFIVVVFSEGGLSVPDHV